MNGTPNLSGVTDPAPAEVYNTYMFPPSGNHLAFALPVPDGSYNVRLFANNGVTAIATEPQLTVGNRERPEQARREDPTVVVMDLRARTGLEEVHSSEREAREPSRTGQGRLA